LPDVVVLNRMARDDGKTGDYIQWTREDPNAGNLVRTRTNKVGHAIGRLKDDARIIQELDQELSDRGYSVEEVAAEYDRHVAQLEREALAAEQDAEGASFVVQDGEVVVRVAASSIDAPSVIPAPAKRGRDRLAWVPVLSRLARMYANRSRWAGP
jgi:hypothetical protein